MKRLTDNIQVFLFREISIFDHLNRLAVQADKTNEKFVKVKAQEWKIERIAKRS